MPKLALDAVKELIRENPDKYNPKEIVKHPDNFSVIERAAIRALDAQGYFEK